jgi:hypothetical protein
MFEIRFHETFFLFMATMLKLIWIQCESMLRLWLAQVSDVSKRHCRTFGAWGKKTGISWLNSTVPTAVADNTAMSCPWKSSGLFLKFYTRERMSPWALESPFPCCTWLSGPRSTCDSGEICWYLVSPGGQGKMSLNKWEMSWSRMKFWCLMLKKANFVQFLVWSNL